MLLTQFEKYISADMRNDKPFYIDYWSPVVVEML